MDAASEQSSPYNGCADQVFERKPLGGTAEGRRKNKKGESRQPQFALPTQMQCLTLWLYLPEVFISATRRLAGFVFGTSAPSRRTSGDRVKDGAKAST